MNPANICTALSSAHGFLKHCRMLRRATRLLRWPRSGFIWPLKQERDKASSMTSGSYRDADRSRRPHRRVRQIGLVYRGERQTLQGKSPKLSRISHTINGKLDELPIDLDTKLLGSHSAEKDVGARRPSQRRVSYPTAGGQSAS
jgi:hypothetical protein